MGLTGGLSRAFYYGLNNMEVIGLERFLETVERRKDVDKRGRGLITGTAFSPLKIEQLEELMA